MRNWMTKASRMAPSRTAMAMVVPGRMAVSTACLPGGGLEADLGGRLQAQLVGGRAPGEGDRDQPVGVDDEADLAGAELVVGGGAHGGAHLVGEAQGDGVAHGLE